MSMGIFLYQRSLIGIIAVLLYNIPILQSTSIAIVCVLVGTYYCKVKPNINTVNHFSNVIDELVLVLFLILSSTQYIFG